MSNITTIRRRLMKKLLSTAVMIISLSVSGMAYADDHWDKKGEHGKFLEEALAKLPEKDAAAFRETIKSAHEQEKASYEQTKKLHEELHAIVIAEKFDKAAYLAKSEEIQTLRA